jgi:hypothetical protein
MVLFMTEQEANFVKLFEFFLYQRTPKAFAYWDLEKISLYIPPRAACAAFGAAE